MKLEVTYTVKEVKRYIITKNHTSETPAHKSWGHSDGREFGLFERERDAQAVADALERTEADRLLTGT